MHKKTGQTISSDEANAIEILQVKMGLEIGPGNPQFWRLGPLMQPGSGSTSVLFEQSTAFSPLTY